MKHTPVINLAWLLFVILSCCEKPEEKSSLNHFSDIRDLFQKPSSEFGTVPFYVWNSQVTVNEIDSAMAAFKKAGFGGVIVHPRPGLITEYMSKEWYDLFKYAVDKGKALDLKVWIYDENSYPSGFAGGHVPAQMPESYNQGQGLNMLCVGVLPDTASAYFICLKEQNGTFTDVTSTIANEMGKQGKYYLFSKTYEKKSPWYGGYSYVDLLYPGVTEKFIGLTMEGYEKVAKNEFGNSVPGIFTDEPNISSPGGIRWTPDLFEVFREKWGYDLRTNLPSLFEEVGKWKTVRHNYTQTMLQLFIDRWARPYHDYCARNNLEFTGHYWEHGWPDMGQGGDNMAMYAWHQTPAIDMLFNQFDEHSPQAQFGNIRAVKELRSAANQMGYKRTLSETYGGGGWEETFRDFKRLGDWEYVLGVNLMNQHLAHMSIAGARKYDYPPTFTGHSPWFPYYKTLNDYFARLSMVLSAGDQINDILILEPTTSIWQYYSYSKSNDAVWKIGRSFQAFITTLENAQVEYDLGSENIIRDHGKVDGKNFIVGKCLYSTVVIPPFNGNIDLPTFQLLKQFAENGGRILAFSEPGSINGESNQEIQTFFSGSANVVHLDTLSSGIMDKFFKKEFPAFTSSGGNLFHQRRIMKDGQILFMVNSDLNVSVRGTVSVEGKDAIEMDAFTGKFRDYPETVSPDGIQLDFEIPPAGSLLLYVFNKRQNSYPAPRQIVFDRQVPSISGLSAKPDEQNVLTIDFCDLKLGKTQFRDLHVFDAADKAFRYNGFVNGNPWNTSVQYKTNITDRDTFKTGGFSASYKFVVEKESEITDMMAVIERPGLYKVMINGKPLRPRPGEWWLDREFGLFDIKQDIKAGENTLTIELSPMKIMAEIEPVYILGHFTVKPAKKGWVISALSGKFTTGSWKANGWPFYAGGVAYRKEFNITEDNGNFEVRLGNWQGTVAAVSVNGVQAGIIAFEPYSLNVSQYIRKGNNTVEVNIIGSNKNLLGPFHNNPDPGLVSPWHFRGVKNYPSGSEYQQLDYGLMDDFFLYSER